MNEARFVIVTQRRIECGDEVRDSLDRRWYNFFLECGLTPLLLPNNVDLAKIILRNSRFAGILLTGGGDISSLGGADRDREEIEEYLINFSIDNNIPLLGVCRGMQKIQDYFGVKLGKVVGHVNLKQEILVSDKSQLVNSYHNFGTTENNEEFLVWALAKDGVIKAVKHRKCNISGIMWHPERFDSFRDWDVKYFRNFYK